MKKDKNGYIVYVDGIRIFGIYTKKQLKKAEEDYKKAQDLVQVVSNYNLTK